jgi:ABC-type phosphate transport system substrate-binding protein
LPARARTQESGERRTYTVIVNADNPVNGLPVRDVSRLFLRKTTSWAHNGQTVLPVELGDGSPVRDAFIREIHLKEPIDVTVYWEQMIYQGKAVPPPDETSDAEVMDYVRSHRNAIGYVSATARLTPDLKAIALTR